MRAKLPQGQGVWPANWMLPEDHHYGTWAASGEIDILEAVNLGVRCDECAGGIEDRILGTLHFGGQWPANVYTGDANPLTARTEAFHVFRTEESRVGKELFGRCRSGGLPCT